MTSKDYTEFDEELVAPILGITRDTEERDEDAWGSWASAMGIGNG